jgi:hypothetical protein
MWSKNGVPALVTVTKTVISDNASPVVYKNNPITYADIMAEAAKLKADAVINIVIDLEQEISASGEPLEAAFTGSKAGIQPDKKVTITEKYTATALAVKYGNTINGGLVTKDESGNAYTAGGNETAPFGGPASSGGAAAPGGGTPADKKGGLFNFFGQ